MKKIIVSIALFLTFYTHNALPTHITAEILFKKWDTSQKIFQASKNLTEFSQHSDPQTFLLLFQKAYQQSAIQFEPFTPFLSYATQGLITSSGQRLASFNSILLLEYVSYIHWLLEYDMPSFITLLHNTTQFTNAPKITIDQEIDRNNMLCTLLFSLYNKEEQHEYLFALANRFFEYCFHPATNTLFQTLFTNKEAHYIIRFLYAIIWFKLAGEGWSCWSQESLTLLKKHHDDGKKIIYVAGGSDILQLLKSEIYNVTIIDPQLPSQPKYYIDSWEWLIKGDGDNYGITDTITLTTHTNATITLTRRQYNLSNETFNATLANNQTITLTQSTTTWEIHNEQGDYLGCYTFERRFINQEDFAQPNTLFLMSFNELFFISATPSCNGWNIKPALFPSGDIFIIKQLSKPLNKEIIGNMRMANLMNKNDVKFIQLGSCIN